MVIVVLEILDLDRLVRLSVHLHVGVGRRDVARSAVSVLDLLALRLLIVLPIP